MHVTRTSLFDGETLQIGTFAARPATDACGDVERQRSHAVVLPVAGVFAKHEAPGHHVIGTPAHAVFFAAAAPIASLFRAPSAIARSPCASPRIWRRRNSAAAAPAAPSRRTGCCRPRP